MRKQLLLEQLADNAGINSLDDRFKSGYISAVNDLLRVEIEETDID